MSAISDAYWRVALAGRELGSGPAEAGKRIYASADGELPPGINEKNVPAIVLGIAIGLVASGDEVACHELDAIHDEWRRTR